MSRNSNTWTYGKMTSVQTRQAVHYIKNSDMDSAAIAKKVSGFKNSPKIKTTTISHLRTHVAVYKL